MTAPRGPGARASLDRKPPEQESLDRERWFRAVGLRAEWLGHALSCAPADRAAAEAATVSLYALHHRPPPRFVWVGSPAAARRHLPPDPVLSTTAPVPLESRIAGALWTLRRRLERHLDVDRDGFGRRLEEPAEPLTALRSGTPLRTVLDAGVHGALRQSVHESVAGLIRAALPARPRFGWYGQQEAHWIAHYDIHRRLGARFSASDTAHLGLWAALARSCGWWWPREDVCVLSDRPQEIHTEPIAGGAYGEIRLHNAEGPAVLFRDGWSCYAWHGTAVPPWVIESPTAERITEERNTEVRRCAIERIGWPEFIAQAGLSLVARAPDPGNPGAELLLYDAPYRQKGASARLLLAVNGSQERDGTRRRYGLHVPPWFDDALDAAGWSYGLTGAQYAGLLRRT